MKAHRTAQGKCHEQRDDLTGEPPLGHTGQILFGLLFAGVWIADSFFLKYTTQLNDYIPVAFRIPIGILLLFLSVYCTWAGLKIVFNDVRETPSVIRNGIFGLVRHPIYLSEVLLYLGLFMISMSLAAALVLFGAGVFLYYICRYEERLLLERFGDDYRSYTLEVGMWVPRLFRNGDRRHT